MVIALSLLVACGDDAEEAGPPPDLVADAVRLQDAVTADPALGPIEDAEAMVDDERHALAAELLEQGGIPAAERQVEAVRAVELSTRRGRLLRRRLARAYEQRVEALERYQEVLSRGFMEDLALVEAMGGLREAINAITEVDDEIAEIRSAPRNRGRGGQAAPFAARHALIAASAWSNDVEGLSLVRRPPRGVGRPRMYAARPSVSLLAT